MYNYFDYYLIVYLFLSKKKLLVHTQAFIVYPK